jgi:hypothetical protein
MRERDVRAIAFCVLSSAAVVVVAQALLRHWLPVLALVSAYEAWLLTRPRMIRVMRRLRGERVEWSSYFED